MLAEAKHLETVPDTNQRSGTKAVHYAEAVTSVEGRRFRARLVIREALDGKRHYDHDLSEIREELGGTPGDDQRRSVQDQPSLSAGGAGPAGKELSASPHETA